MMAQVLRHGQVNYVMPDNCPYDQINMTELNDELKHIILQTLRKHVPEKWRENIKVTSMHVVKETSTKTTKYYKNGEA